MVSLRHTFRIIDRTQRKFRRYNLYYPVRVQYLCGAIQTRIDAISKNVSMGGLLLECGFVIPSGTGVKFVITINHAGMVRPIRVAGTGTVVRIEPTGSHHQFQVAIQCKTPAAQVWRHLPVAS